MKMKIPYFQSDDIPQSEPKKDCIHAHYQIWIGETKIKEGRFALKQTRRLEGERTIFKRLWNESKREWKTEWILTDKK